MLRTQVQLTEAQVKKLKRIAAERDLPLAELVRQGIDLYLEASPFVSRQERRRRALDAAGKYGSDKTDLSEKHDKYLAEIYGK